MSWQETVARSSLNGKMIVWIGRGGLDLTMLCGWRVHGYGRMEDAMCHRHLTRKS